MLSKIILLLIAGGVAAYYIYKYKQTGQKRKLVAAIALIAASVGVAVLTISIYIKTGII